MTTLMNGADANNEPNLLLVVIVNYRTSQLTIECLRSLAGEVRSLPGTRVVVVDNNSGDGSAEKIGTAIATEAWESWASLLPSSHNGGYAYGNNLAIRPALQQSQPPSYFLLLNPDSQVRPGALKALVDFAEQNPTVGIMGSGLENPDGSPWSTAFRFPSILSELEQGMRLGLMSKLLSRWVVSQKMGEHPQQVDWLPGASMMVRRQVFEAIGLLDEEYFLYYEETDFCLQAKRAGWSCWYVPASRVMHIAGQSTGVTDRDAAPKRLPQYVFDSRQRYFVKNHGVLYAALTDLARLVGLCTWGIRRTIQRKPETNPPHLFWDSLRNSVLFSKVARNKVVKSVDRTAGKAKPATQVGLQ
jgi:N-acetylglucosaminyl-diphospho-decaprenol L-rhamnosyltransferase